MGNFDDDALYVPQTFEQLELRLFENLNQLFGIPTLDDLRNSNIYLKIIKPILQYDLQFDNLAAGIYDNLIKYLTDRFTFESFLRGSSYEGVLNALKQLEFIENVTLIDKNIDNALEAGQVQIALNYNNTPENNQVIATTLLNNLAAGIQMLGSIEEYASTVSTGQAFMFRWSEMTIKVLEVNLTITYDPSSQSPLTLDEVGDFWYNRFQEIYYAGSDINPYVYDTGIPSLNTVSSTYTIDSVAQTPDTTITGEYNVIYTLLRENVTVVEA